MRTLASADHAQLDGATADVVELALWYHDAIYEIGARDSEARSANWLLEDARALGLAEKQRAEAAACIRSTAHLAGAPVSSVAAQWVVDIDLTLLGAHALRFMEFEYGVESEYASVPRELFFRKRGVFLERLLAAPAIYQTDHFQKRCEASARANIAALLKSPRYHKSWWRWLVG